MTVPLGENSSKHNYVIDGENGMEDFNPRVVKPFG